MIRNRQRIPTRPPVGSATANPAPRASRCPRQVASCLPRALSGRLPPTIASGSERDASGLSSWTVFGTGTMRRAAISPVIGDAPGVPSPKNSILRRQPRPFDGDARGLERFSYDFVTTTSCTRPVNRTPIAPNFPSGPERRQLETVNKPGVVSPPALHVLVTAPVCGDLLIQAQPPAICSPAFYRAVTSVAARTSPRSRAGRLPDQTCRSLVPREALAPAAQQTFDDLDRHTANRRR
jgi:hypothetical protein